MSKDLVYSIEDAFARTGDMLLKRIPSSSGGLTDEQRVYYQTRPVEFSREILGSDPYNRQEDILQSVADNQRTTVRSSHGVGKSWDAAECVLWFLSCFVPSTVVTTAPTSRQVKDILWREINSQFAQSKIPLGGRMLTMNWEMSRDIRWFATGFTTEEHDLDRFQGFHNENILVIVDEACGVSTNIYNAIEGLLSAGTTVRLLLIGNPTNEATDFGKSFKSPLYNKFYLSAFDLPNFTEFGITLDDVRTTQEIDGKIVGDWQKKITGPLPRPYLTTPRWAAERYVEWGEESPLFQVRVLGNFPIEGEDTLIPLFWVERAQQLRLEPSGEKVLGADIARFGNDESVISFRHGGVVYPFKFWTHKSTMHTAGVIKNSIDEISPDSTNIDVIGVGSGVVDRLIELGYEINEVNVGERSWDADKFFNLRAELYWSIREILEKNSLQLPDDSTLAGELTGFKYEYTSKGQLKLEAKEKTRARVGRSPNRGDALALTFYASKPRIEVSEDIGNIHLEAEGESELEKIYKPLTLEYNKREVVCHSCNHTEGIVLYNDAGMADLQTATNARCIICNISWSLEEEK